jgi:twinkle protein
MTKYEPSTWLETKLECHSCGSSDAYCIGEQNGYQHGHCFSCNLHEKIDNNPKKEVVPMNKDKDAGTIEAIGNLDSIDLQDRGISRGVSNVYKVKSQVNKEGKEISRYYPITRKGDLVAYKRRVLPKDFSIVGSTSNHIELFGQSLWPNGGKFLVVTVGEEDAMACYQMTAKQSKSGKGYASVSVVNGASAIQNIKNNLEWLEKFETIVFAVDQEELDLTEARKWCELLSVGKTKIARFEEKDANEMLKEGKEKEFIDAIRNAKKYISKGTVFSGMSFETFSEESFEIGCLPYPEVLGLGDLLPGFVPGKTDIVVAPIKSGKTTVVTHLIHELIKNKEKVALFSTEISAKNMLKKLMSLELGCNLRRVEESALVEYKDKYENLFGVTDDDSSLIINTCEDIRTVDDVLIKCRQYSLGYDVKYIFIDNLTGFYKQLSGEGNEMQIASKLSLELTAFAKNNDTYMGLVLHTRKKMGSPNKKYQSDITVDSAYGSGDAVRWCDNVLAITKVEKDNQEEGFYSQIRVLASRDNRTGKGNLMSYDAKTTKFNKTLDIAEKVCYTVDINNNNVL